MGTNREARPLSLISLHVTTINAGCCIILLYTHIFVTTISFLTVLNVRNTTVQKTSRCQEKHSVKR